MGPSAPEITSTPSPFRMAMAGLPMPPAITWVMPSAATKTGTFTFSRPGLGMTSADNTLAVLDFHDQELGGFPEVAGHFPVVAGYADFHVLRSV